MQKQTVATLNSRIALSSNLRRGQKEGALTTYCKLLNYLLETYATNDVIAESDAEIMHYTQPPNKTPAGYTCLLWSKALHCDHV